MAWASRQPCEASLRTPYAPAPHSFAESAVVTLVFWQSESPGLQLLQAVTKQSLPGSLRSVLPQKALAPAFAVQGLPVKQLALGIFQIWSNGPECYGGRCDPQVYEPHAPVVQDFCQLRS